MITTVTSKGQVTLPIDARRQLGIEEGTKLAVIVTDDHHIELVPLGGSVQALKGMVKSKKKLSLEEIEGAIVRGANS